MSAPWLSVIGIGLDGWDGLSGPAKTLIGRAEVLFGSERQLDLVPSQFFSGERRVWRGLGDTIDSILSCRGRPVATLTSGDPMFYGLGATLARGRVGADEMTVIPAPGAYSLIAARLGWPLQDCAFLTAHGRPVDNLAAHLYPGARWLVLCADGATPKAVAALLAAHGYGKSRLTAIADLGGDDETRTDALAETWAVERTADLVTLAVACVAGPDAAPTHRLPGLPDDAYSHDGQLTKREVRAQTVCALGPYPRARLWDVGAGSGSVGIEWQRAGGGPVVAFEKDAARASTVAHNAARLGGTWIEVVEAEAPDCLAGRDDIPDAVFVGGQVGRAGMLEACWEALRPGGVMVANAVIEASRDRLTAWHDRHGGTLTRLAVARFVDGAWDDKAPIVQWRGVKP